MWPTACDLEMTGTMHCSVLQQRLVKFMDFIVSAAAVPSEALRLPMTVVPAVEPSSASKNQHFLFFVFQSCGSMNVVITAVVVGCCLGFLLLMSHFAFWISAAGVPFLCVWQGLPAFRLQSIQGTMKAGDGT